MSIIKKIEKKLYSFGKYMEKKSDKYSDNLYARNKYIKPYSVSIFGNKKKSTYQIQINKSMFKDKKVPHKLVLYKDRYKTKYTVDKSYNSLNTKTKIENFIKRNK